MATKNIHYRFRRFMTATAIVLGAFLLSGSASFGWNFTVPATEIKPVNGSFVFPLAAFQDGKARHFEYMISPNERIRFFIVKSADGNVRAALDACEVCYRAKKGYVQQGNDMVCINCGLKFKTDKINEIRGGCNPVSLRRSIQGANLVISQQDLMSGLKYFK